MVAVVVVVIVAIEVLLGIMDSVSKRLALN